MIEQRTLRSMITRFPATLAFLAGSTLAISEEQRGDQPDARPLTPQEQLAKFHVPPGFEVQLVAAEPDIQKPMNLNFDAAGRLWMTGSELYPWPAKRDANGQPIPEFQKNWDDAAKQFRVGDQAPAPKDHGTDTVRVLSEFGPDGRARKIELFADGLNIPTGIQPLPRVAGAPRASPRGAVQMNSVAYIEKLRAEAKGDSAVVYSIPNIWMMTDSDGDGRADVRAPLYEGFGFKDTHGMSSNYLHWIDGWIYGCHGFSNRSEIKDRLGKVLVMESGNTYRFKPDGSKIEYYTHGQTNPFGLTVDPLGNFYSADSHSKPVYLLLRGGYYEGIGKQHDGLGFAPRITEDDHGSSAIAGIAYYADEKWPEEFRGNLFNGNPVTRRINRVRLEWNGATPKAVRMPDFLTCDDPWFRPVQVKLGPDGALWIADFYNPIIGHYEVPLTDPRRDHQHGRIWRVVWRGEKSPGSDRPATASPGRAGVSPAGSRVSRDPSEAKAVSPSERIPQNRADGAGKMPAPAGGTPAIPGTVPDLTKLDAQRLVETLADPNLIVRTLATHELVERVGKDRAASFRKVFLPTNESEIMRSTVSISPKWNSPPRQRAHALWAAYRAGVLNEVDSRAIARAFDDSPEVHIAVLRMIGGKSEHLFSDRIIEGLTKNDAQIRRAAVEAIVAPVFLQDSDNRVLTMNKLSRLLDTWDQADPKDLQLIYAIRVALRHGLSAKGGFLAATNLVRNEADLMDWSEHATRRTHRLAEIALAIPTTESGDFLLRHLKRTSFKVPRAAEFLRHATLHLPSERLPEIASLIQNLEGGPLVQTLAVAEGLAQASRERGMKLPEQLLVWSERVMIAALNSDDVAVLDRAIAAMREVKLPAKIEPLRKIVTDAGGHGPRRAAALEALMNLEEGREIAAQKLADPSSMTLRKKAAELLAPMAADKKIEATLLATLPVAPWEIAATIAAGLAKTDSGTEALLALIESGKAAPALLRNKVVAAQLAARSVPLRDRAAGLTKDLPPEDARLDAVIAQRVESFRKAQPNREKGAQLFAQQCAVCHRLRDIGGNVGPNLDGMAARGVHRLAEDILDPNRNVDPAFRQTVIETSDGQTVAGVNLRDQGNALTLSDVTGKELTMPKATIKTRTESRLSLMPPVYESQLTPEDFSDLLGYLLAPAD